MRRRAPRAPRRAARGAGRARVLVCEGGGAGPTLRDRKARQDTELGNMKFFVDTADIDEIRDLAAAGMVDGVTTNPSLIMKSGRDIIEVTKEICDLVPGPVSAEVAATEYEAMVAEGRILAKIAPNVCIKVPLTLDGLRACRTFASEGHKVNVTLCFSANQALLAAKAGATFISPFVGRLDDINVDGMELISEIRQIYDNYDFKTEILVASIRTANHIREAALIGADVVTAPPAVLRGLASHPLTDKGLATFLADWQKTGQSIA
jgi:transaldolase